MYCMMYVAIIRRGSGGRSPPDVGVISQILAPPYLKVLPTPLLFYPKIEDLASIKLADVIKILAKPMSTATKLTKRSAGFFMFDVEVRVFGG